MKKQFNQIYAELYRYCKVKNVEIARRKSYIKDIILFLILAFLGFVLYMQLYSLVSMGKRRTF